MNREIVQSNSGWRPEEDVVEDTDANESQGSSVENWGPSGSWSDNGETMPEDERCGFYKCPKCKRLALAIGINCSPDGCVYNDKIWWGNDGSSSESSSPIR